MEKDVNLVEALACLDFLKAHGAQAFMSYTKNDTLTEKTCGGNEFSPGLVKKGTKCICLALFLLKLKIIVHIFQHFHNNMDYFHTLMDRLGYSTGTQLFL